MIEQPLILDSQEKTTIKCTVPDIDLQEIIDIYNHTLEKTTLQKDRLLAKVTEIANRVSSQRASNAKLSEKLQNAQERLGDILGRIKEA